MTIPPTNKTYLHLLKLVTGVESSTRCAKVFVTEGKLNIANRRTKAVAYISFDFLDSVVILLQNRNEVYIGFFFHFQVSFKVDALFLPSHV